ncbi:MAG TPA: hypothetical protein VN976_21785 [Verrucomicrobiae bacterium]|nr:hypothetical protein [Verrucomicrobiae bacterium]
MKHATLRQLNATMQSLIPALCLGMGVNLQQSGYREHSSFEQLLGFLLIATALGTTRLGEPAATPDRKP